MNGKKARLLRRLSILNVKDAEQPFKSHDVRKWKKKFLIPAEKTQEDGSEFKTVTIDMEAVRLKASCPAFIYHEMKASYPAMKRFYNGMRSQNAKANENQPTV